MLVTTLDFALRNFLDITSIIVGWGQSGETGGKAHFAGVGFGGENALLQAFEIAREAHGHGVGDFEYLVAHATGTRTNSKTDLTTVANARVIAARQAGSTARAAADGGRARRRRRATATRWVRPGSRPSPRPSATCSASRRSGSRRCAGSIPTWPTSPRRSTSTPRRCPGDTDGGAICATQGFGGYNGAVALRAANADSLARYRPEPAVLAAYLERWPEIRRERERRERRPGIRRGTALELAEQHRWV